MQGYNPRIHRPEVVVLALPAERAGRSPGFHNQVMRFVETLPVVNRVGVGGPTLLAKAPDKPANHPAAGDAVNHGDFFGHAQGFSWMGSTLPRNTIFPCLVILDSTAPMTLTEGIIHKGLLWCSLIITPSKPGLGAVLKLLEVHTVQLGSLFGAEVLVGKHQVGVTVAAGGFLASRRCIPSR